ncbi:hypothetical protein [Methanobrevibacter sp. DSM 116169]|uniref:hypothetical protein n=1 Tax=Methanobrevibacter sp. DSM 116169 TaxID=3242727 RepID=UPI0038FD3EFE
MANIEISDDFIDKINLIRNENESFEQCLKRLIPGYEKNFNNINRDQEAFTLTFEEFNDEEEIIASDYLVITYQQLKESNKDDIFEIEKIDLNYFINQKAKVIYKDEDSVLIKFIDVINTASKKLEDFEIVAYHFI